MLVVIALSITTLKIYMDITLALIFGLIIGSFLNVIIHRLPKQLFAEDINIFKPYRSFCPVCKSDLTAIELIPILSYIIQRGKCKNCNTNISIQYPLVEFASSILTFLVVIKFGINFDSFLILIFCYTLISLFVIDINEKILPDILTISLLWFGLIINMDAKFSPINEAILGAMFGYLALWTIYWVFKLILKREGMGYGDFKLTAAFGAWFGISSITPILLIASILGILYALLSRQKKSQPFAFGPFLIIAGFVLLFFPEIRLYY